MRVLCVILGALLLNCAAGGSFRPIAGFGADTNAKLSQFFQEMRTTSGRKVAVFDGDGTTLGQSPHYLADECLYEHAAKHPKKKPAVIQKMRRLSNVSLPYVQYRVHFFEGDTLESVRDLGADCFARMYADKIFPPMRDLIENLKEHGFEVWIVTASPEALYQKFLSAAFGIPITHVIGVRSIIRDGRITRDMVHPIPQDHGKKEAIETFIQARPQFVGGNSRGDKEMIEFASHVRLIINPDTHVGHDQKESIADFARRQGWLVESIRDVPPNDFPYVSSKKFGVRKNAEKQAPAR